MLLTPPERPRRAPNKPNRRSKAVLDPYALFTPGETHLREKLGSLDLEQLKDVIAEYVMDGAWLAMKWKAPDRLITLIVYTVSTRSRKGDAFRAEVPRAPRVERALAGWSRCRKGGFCFCLSSGSNASLLYSMSARPPRRTAAVAPRPHFFMPLRVYSCFQP